MQDRAKYLRIAVRKFSPFESAIQKQWEAYCKETHCEMRLEAVPMDLPELHQSTLKNSGLKNGEWDIAHLSSDWIKEAYNSSAVEDFIPFIREKNYFTDWPNALIEAQKIDHKVLGIPFHDGPECLIYRTDLFEDRENKNRYWNQYKSELAPPASWEEFINTATFFYQPERNLYGSVFAAYPDRHNAVFDFCLQVWTRGGVLTDKAGRLQIDSPAAAEGLNFIRQIFRKENCLHPQSADIESVGAGELFAKGEIAMMINWFGFASVCEFAETSNVKGKLNVAPIPFGKGGESVSLNSYWMYSVGSGSQNKKVAVDFVKFATNRDNDKLLTLEGGIGCRHSTCHSTAINDIVPYYYKLERLHTHAKTLPSVSYWPDVAAVIDNVMQKAIHSSENIPDILKAGQRIIHKIIVADGN